MKFTDIARRRRALYGHRSVREPVDVAAGRHRAAPPGSAQSDPSAARQLRRRRRTRRAARPAHRRRRRTAARQRRRDPRARGRPALAASRSPARVRGAGLARRRAAVAGAITEARGPATLDPGRAREVLLGRRRSRRATSTRARRSCPDGTRHGEPIRPARPAVPAVLPCAAAPSSPLAARCSSRREAGAASPRPLHDYLDIAFLRGGPAEAIRVAVLTLVERGAAGHLGHQRRSSGG